MSEEAVFDPRETAASLSARPTRSCEGCGGGVEVAQGLTAPLGQFVSSFYVALHAGHACPLCGCGIQRAAAPNAEVL